MFANATVDHVQGHSQPMLINVVPGLCSRRSIGHDPLVWRRPRRLLHLDEAEADFWAWSLVYDSLKWNSSTLQTLLAGYDAKATGLIAAAGVVIGLSTSVVSQKAVTGLGAFLTIGASSLLLACVIFGLLVLRTGIVQVPYIGVDQIHAKPGPRDELARNLVVVFSRAIAASQPTFARKEWLFKAQVALFIGGVAILGIELIFLAATPQLISAPSGADLAPKGPSLHIKTGER